MNAAPRDSREWGLLLVHHLFGLDELHFGLWPPGAAPRLGDLPAAQRRYTEHLLDRLPPPAAAPRVLDAGCGTGSLMLELWRRGYRPAGVSPSPALNARARARLARAGAGPVEIHDGRFEDLPVGRLGGAYDLVIFSESFQYIKMPQVFDVLAALLRPGGRFLVCDVFSRRGPRHDPIRSGHPLARFFDLVARAPFEQERDEDLTERTSPTVALLEEVLQRRLRPALALSDAYLARRHPLGWRVLRLLAGRRWRRARRHYLEGEYHQRAFEAAKTYRLFVYRRREGTC